MSLGVDLVPPKTCSLNCVYCESGRTTLLTLERKEYIPTVTLIDELRQFLSQRPTLDYITFSGSGEPTLHSGIAKIVRFLKTNFGEYKTALLTNGTLFHDPRVRADVNAIDVVLPSLDAASPAAFKKINRPARQLNIEHVIAGLAEFKQEYAGQMLLEIFIVPGINDAEEEIAALRQAIHRIRPDRVQLNSLDRPGVAAWVKAATPEQLAGIAAKLDWPSEIIAKFKKREELPSYQADTAHAILQMIKRRPCTVEDLSAALGLNAHEINKFIASLLAAGHIQTARMQRGVFFMPANAARD